MTARRPTGRRPSGGGARPVAGRPAAPGARRGPGSGRSAARDKPAAARDKPAGSSRPTGSSRPSPGAPSARAAEREGEEEATSPTVTLRALGLFVVVLVAFIVLAPTLRHAVEQQEQLRQLNGELEAVEERQAALELELEQWQDPTFVRAQARDRLGYVMPGEQTFRVVDPETVVGEEAEAELAESGVPGLADAPWYVSVWESVEMAGEAAPDEDEPTGG